MSRPTDWRSDLAKHIEANRERPHQWGEHDCALWAAGARAVARGCDDLGEPYRGTYGDAKGSVRRMRELDGVRTPWELADKLIGPRLNVAMARAGDVVAADLGDGPSLGICFGATSYFVGEDGLVGVPTLSLEHCYHG
jgi:hypothetical protein